MAIKYQIIKSRLLNETKFVGRVSLKGSFDQEQLVKRMLEMGTSLSKQDINGVLSLFESAVERICGEGNKVTLNGFVQFTPTMSGTFNGEMDMFEVNRNQIYITSQISRTFNDRFAQTIGVEKIKATEKRPYLFEVDDLGSEETNSKVTQGGIVTIYGERLKFTLGAPDEHLRLVNADESKEFAEIGKFQKIAEGEIVFQAPRVEFPRGYFELASSMGTTTIRLGRSQTVDVVTA